MKKKHLNERLPILENLNKPKMYSISARLVQQNLSLIQCLLILTLTKTKQQIGTANDFD